MNYKESALLETLPFIGLAFLGTFLAKDHIFFWDTVQLGAKHATFFYENKFKEWILPDEFDSGHIPTFGMYLAIVWMLFGKSLIVSHFAMLPILVGIIMQARLLLKKFVPSNYVFWGMAIFLADPTLMSQATLISPDLALVFFFLLGINSVLGNNRWLLSLSLLGLFTISMRGNMIALGILILDLVFNFDYKNKQDFWHNLIKMSLAYLPGFTIFCLYNGLHYYQKSWIGYHDASPWAASFQRTNIIGMVKNVIILGWRMADFGRIFLWIFVIFMVYRNYKKYIKDQNFRKLSLVFLIITICISISFIAYLGLNAHRYLLPAILSFELFVIYILFQSNIKNKKIIAIMLTFGLWTGNLWIYPNKISQGWDSTLAHWPYYDLRNKILGDIRQKNLSINEIACFFPNLSEMKYLDLSDSKEKHQFYNRDSSQYVLYSNIYNDFPKEDLTYLNQHFKVISHHQKMGVFMTLYQRK